jgi:homoserine O-succinyltransferase
MPVFVSSGPLGYRPFVTGEALRDKKRTEFADPNVPGIDLGLINNMSDAALETTERQILKLLDAAAKDLVVRLRLYSLPDFPRSDLGQRHLKSLHYLGVGDLWNTHLDGLIVTGAEPRAPDLMQEAYWSTLTDVFRWAEDSTLSMISSCLAVHAAVLHVDGIGRYPLDEKCFGIFEFENLNGHPLTEGVPERLHIPHSRWNEVRSSDLSSCGYTVLSGSQRWGVDMFVKETKSLFVFFQGHPEYEAWTLLNEYRRDIERFIRGERDTYPRMPLKYFDEETVNELRCLQERALTTRSMELLKTFPTAVGQRLLDPWRETAIRIYRNWLLFLSAQKNSKSGFASFVARS